MNALITLLITFTVWLQSQPTWAVNTALAVLAGWLLLTFFITLWVYFLAVMNLRDARNRGALVGWVRVPAYMVLFRGLLHDFAAQLVLCVLLWSKPPRKERFPWIESTVSAHVKRLVLGPNGWRRWVALRFTEALAPFDVTGKHGPFERIET